MSSQKFEFQKCNAPYKVHIKNTNSLTVDLMYKKMMFPCKPFPTIIFILITTLLFLVGECFSPNDKMTAAARVGKPPPFKPSKRKAWATSVTSSSDSSRHHHRNRMSVVGKPPSAMMENEGDSHHCANQYGPYVSNTKRNCIESDDEDILPLHQAIFCGYSASPEDFLRLRSAHV